MKTKSTVYGQFADKLTEGRLGDLCTKVHGIQTGPFGSQLHREDYVTEGTPILTVEHLGENRIIHQDLPCVSKNDKERLSKYCLVEGDIVFSRVGSVDRRSIVRQTEAGWLFSGRCLRVRPDQARIDPVFLSYFFGLPAFTEYVRAIAVGATMPSLNTKILSDLTILYPPLSEQRAIAHILGTLDDKIDLNRRMNQTLEEMARAIYKDWFVDFGPVRAKLEGREPYLPRELWDLFPDRLVDSELGEIPEGWVLKTLRELTKTVKGRSYKSSELADSETALVTLKSFQRGGGYRRDGLKAYVGEFKPEQVILPGELIIACTDVTQAGEVIGHPALVEPTTEYKRLVASLDTVIVRPTSDEAGREFLYFTCCTEGFIAHTAARSTGTTVLHLSKDAIPSFQIPLPPENTMGAFTKTVRPFFEHCSLNQRRVDNLVSQRETLLPKLISGAKEVSIK